MLFIIMTLEEKVNKVFNSGYSIKIKNTAKRMDGEWYNRIEWGHVQQPLGGLIESCDWEGFETFEECIDDCLKYIEKLKNKK